MTRRDGYVVAAHLWPAFVARRWPMREMVCPQRRTCGQRSRYAHVPDLPQFTGKPQNHASSARREGIGWTGETMVSTLRTALSHGVPRGRMWL